GLVGLVGAVAPLAVNRVPVNRDIPLEEVVRTGVQVGNRPADGRVSAGREVAADVVVGPMDCGRCRCRRRPVELGRADLLPRDVRAGSNAVTRTVPLDGLPPRKMLEGDGAGHPGARLGIPDPGDYEGLDLIEEAIRLVGLPTPDVSAHGRATANG